MGGIEPVAPIGRSNAVDPGSDADNNELQEAFSDGLVRFYMTMYQSMQSDIIDSIQDNSSDPDAPS